MSDYLVQVTPEREHEILVEARDHLARAYLSFKLFEDDQRYSQGPVCAHGAILRSSQQRETPHFVPFKHGGNEYWGGIYRHGPLHKMFERLDEVSESIFGVGYNLVEVNNYLGQDSALMVFDARIKEVEDQIANKLIESANQALPEPVLA